MSNTQLAMTPDNAIEGFAARLHEVCADKKLPERGRAGVLGKKFKVSREAARRWLAGLAYPTTAKRLEVCAWGNVTDVWLMTGKGDKHPVASNLTDHQRLALDYMGAMTMEQQALAVRLLRQLLDEDDPDESPHPATGAGRPALRLHEGRPPYRGSGKPGSGR